MEDDVLVLIEDISIFTDEEELYSIFPTLPKYRQDKILAIKDENGKRLSLLVGKLFKEGLKEFGLPDYDEKVVIEDTQHPYIPGNPVYFAMSHSGTKAMVVISKRKCGCDIQFMKDDSSTSLAERFFNESEYDEIRNNANPVETFYKYWSLKECYMKASGKGLSLGLKNAVVKDGKIADPNYISECYKVADDYMVAYIVEK